VELHENDIGFHEVSYKVSEDGCQRSETRRRKTEGQRAEYREQVELLIDDNPIGITSKILRPFAKNFGELKSPLRL
jgi:hypothetical protein